ncbi:MAG: hypothetical protein P9M00_00415 [Candidatus Tritonobacter lacicola]|nr:hypothetical protein [Candidatus Tritonobacter lacicola]
MNPYLIDTKPAVIDLIQLLDREKKLLLEKQSLAERMIEYERDLFENGKKSGFSAEVLIDLGGFHEASKRFTEDAAVIQRSLLNMESTHLVFAAALLQVAKQGISVVHGSLSQCPSGRAIGRDYLKTVIWAARNQSMHYEEGNFNRSVVDCFHNLQADFGSQFTLGAINRADRIVELLGWYDYNHYESDMVSLLG